MTEREREDRYHRFGGDIFSTIGELNTFMGTSQIRVVLSARSGREKINRCGVDVDLSSIAILFFTVLPQVPVAGRLFPCRWRGANEIAFVTTIYNKLTLSNDVDFEFSTEFEIARKALDIFWVETTFGLWPSETVSHTCVRRLRQVLGLRLQRSARSNTNTRGDNEGATTGRGTSTLNHAIRTLPAHPTLVVLSDRYG